MLVLIMQCAIIKVEREEIMKQKRAKKEYTKVDWADTIVNPNKDKTRCPECDKLKFSKYFYSSGKSRECFICVWCLNKNHN
jgi:hypothetical protein